MIPPLPTGMGPMTVVLCPCESVSTYGRVIVVGSVIVLRSETVATLYTSGE